MKKPGRSRYSRAAKSRNIKRLIKLPLIESPLDAPVQLCAAGKIALTKSGCGAVCMSYRDSGPDMMNACVEGAFDDHERTRAEGGANPLRVG